MKISGAYHLPVAQERAYTLLQDPQILAQCIPGCDALTLIAPDEYEMKMKLAISSVQGVFSGKVRIADRNPPVSFRLIVEGKGKVGFMKGDGVLKLEQLGEGTDVHYDGDVTVGGVIAGVGQRLIDVTAKFIIKKFFDRLVQLASSPIAEKQN